MQIHQISRPASNRKAQQVGRGGKRGKTSGRGGKGQTARAGNKPRPQMRDIIKKLPKRRGMGKNSNKSIVSVGYVQTVNLSSLETSFENGVVVTRGALFDRGLIRRSEGALPTVKILGNGEITKKLIIAQDINCSAGAKLAIEKAGGSFSGKAEKTEVKKTAKKTSKK
ncbi:MAG: uL15 family ribosomal protein [Minisyncoccia bacterium]